MTKIQWTDETWNSIVGCSRVSLGCQKCYASTAASSSRLQQFPQYQKVKDWDGTVEFVESHLSKPLGWKKPKKIFVCSMSDLFHENVPDEWRDRIFAIIAIAHQHTFQVLTKRPERMLEYFRDPKTIDRIEEAGYEFTHNMDCLDRWPLPNAWLGTTVENQRMAEKRIPLLLQTPAKMRWLSVEPMLEPINIASIKTFTGSLNAFTGLVSLDCGGSVEEFNGGVNWIVIGGESGADSRPCHIDWVRSLVNQCK